MKFFTYEEGAGGLPTKKNIEEAREVLGKFARGNNFENDFLFYGSLAKGTYNFRSDVDAVMIVRDKDYTNVLYDFYKVQKEIHKAISLENLLILPQSVAKSTRSGLQTHLLAGIRVYNEVVTGDPLLKLSDDGIPSDVSFESYLAKKTNRCLKALSCEKVSSHESVCQFLESIYCVPSHIIRNFVFLVEESGHEPKSFDKWILDFLKPYDSALSIVEKMTEMERINSLYKDKLEDKQLFCGNPANYQSMCRQILHQGAFILLDILKESHIVLSNYKNVFEPA